MFQWIPVELLWILLSSLELFLDFLESSLIFLNLMEFLIIFSIFRKTFLFLLKSFGICQAMIMLKKDKLTFLGNRIHTIWKTSNLKRLKLLNINWTYKFDLMYLIPFRYKFIQYLIEKFWDMVKIRQEGLVVATLLTSVRMSWKVPIYYMNGALSILKW